MIALILYQRKAKKVSPVIQVSQAVMIVEIIKVLNLRLIPKENSAIESL